MTCLYIDTNHTTYDPDSNFGPSSRLVPVVAAEVAKDAKFTSHFRARNEGQTLSNQAGKWKNTIGLVKMIDVVYEYL